MLIYVYQGYVETIKGNLAIYLDYFITGQIMQAAKVPQNIESHECVHNEVKIAVPIYDLSTGVFRRLKKNIGLHYTQR